MELHFSEAENYNFQNKNYPKEETFDKYWKQETPSSQKFEQKKKKVSFGDILNNMNLVVNNSGELQFMSNTPQSHIQENQNTDLDSRMDSYPQMVPPRSQYEETRTINKNNPIQPEVKHSYIYNKYFKGYIDVNNKQMPEPKVPKTLAEYKKMVIEERIRVFNEKQRISKIKSKKMLFTNAGNINATKNTLYNMKFH